MNADVRQSQTEPEAYRPTVPDLLLRRLQLRLGRAAANGEALDASLAYGAPYEVLSELVDYWRESFELERQPFFELPLFTTLVDAQSWCFAHVRSPEAFALPLLMLHGYS